MTRTELLELRNKDLRKRYLILINKENRSVNYALDKLETEFYITSNTIWLIVSGTGFYKKKIK